MAAGTRTVGKKKIKIRWKRVLPMYLLALPGIIYMICNNYIPMFGITIAFKKLNVSKGFWGSDWCGLDNFKFLFKSSTTWTIIRNTILYNVTFIILGTVISIAAAILLNEVKNYAATRFYQSVILLPYLMSWVVVSYLVYTWHETNQLVSGTEILAFYPDFLQHLEGNRLFHDHLSFQHCGDQPGLL